MTKSISIPRVVIAGTSSGVGKTTVTAALCRAWRRMGLRVAVFKCGPDYLDPTYHFRASGVRSQTLDGWMMGREGVLSTFQSASEGSDIAVIEGVMGLFDGVEPTSDAGSTAEIAKWLGAPVVLVIDASGMSRSVAAMAAGFASFDPDLVIAGVICNRVGSKGHAEILKAASIAVPVLGALPRDAKHGFPERHLGLKTASESALPDALFEAWAGHAAEWCDLERILSVARSARECAPVVSEVRAVAPRICRVGIAIDDAFHFYYDENLRLLREAGAELVEFSPMHSARLPDVDGLYLGGGYPEIHAEALSRNETMRGDIAAFCQMGRPVYAECGGLMYLCEAIRTFEGARFPMVGWFRAEAVMSGKLQALGYVEVATSLPTILGAAGERFRGHQFRYSALEWRAEAENAYRVERRRDRKCFEEGYSRGGVLGSYVHAHWASSSQIAENFCWACAASE